MSGLDRSTSALLGMGANVGDPKSAMAAALRMIDAHVQITVTIVSSLYRTPPWGKLDQPPFLNAVASVRTALEPRTLLDACLEAEQMLKRVRTERWGPRIIDVDVLWFGDRTVDEPGLQIPHPRMQERAFVMVPLAEIDPDLILGGAAARDVASALDRTGIERITVDGEWWRD